MKTIFAKEQFKLCIVPVPSDYPQSQTHCGVAEVDGKIVMTTSPYPAIKYSRFLLLCIVFISKLRKIIGLKKIVNAESYENPCIYISEKKDNESTRFKLMQERPLMECPDPYYGYPAFNSDPDVFAEDQTVYVLNRAVYRTKVGKKREDIKYNIRLYLITGIVDGDKFRLQNIELLRDDFERKIISPCLTKYKGRYVLFELETESYNDGKTFEGLFYQSFDNIEKVTEDVEWKKIEVESDDYLPWHMSVFSNEGLLYAVVACIKIGTGHRCYQMLGRFSEDLKVLKIYKTPLTDYMSYRSSAIVKDEQFLLYNAVVREKIKGSKSVDGRDILMAKMNFSLLIQTLESAE